MRTISEIVKHLRSLTFVKVTKVCATKSDVCHMQLLDGTHVFEQDGSLQAATRNMGIEEWNKCRRWYSRYYGFTDTGRYFNLDDRCGDDLLGFGVNHSSDTESHRLLPREGSWLVGSYRSVRGRERLVSWSLLTETEVMITSFLLMNVKMAKDQFDSIVAKHSVLDPMLVHFCRLFFMRDLQYYIGLRAAAIKPEDRRGIDSLVARYLVDGDPELWKEYNRILLDQRVRAALPTPRPKPIQDNRGQKGYVREKLATPFAELVVAGA